MSKSAGRGHKGKSTGPRPNRREALKSLGALAGAGAAARVLTGCAGQDIRSGGGPSGITNLVVVMMENRSYDHYLGARKLEGLGGEGLTTEMSNPDGEGGVVTVYPESVYCVPDPPHGWDSSRTQLAGGDNSGFVTAYQQSQGDVPPHVMGYFGRNDVPIHWAIADAYASCDQWYSSVLGPTWPNRMYLHSGQSGGLKSNELPAPGGINWRSIWHSLTDAGVAWAYYYQDLPFVPLFQGVEVDGTVKRYAYDFFDDAEAGQLPPVAFVEPAFQLNDDHPPHHPMLGQQFLASVYATLAASPQWNNCLLVITYDEAGGFYDHVAPPLAADDRAADGFDQLGFRAPTVVAGPYVEQGHISSVVRDHASVVAHIERMFDLEPLTLRSAEAEDLSELLDAELLAAGTPRPPVTLPAVEVDESTIEDFCYGEGAARHVPTELEQLADSGFFADHLDRRSEARDQVYAIGEQLDRLGAGRIRRR